MSIRIINPEPDPKVLKQIVCQSCGVELEYVPNEVQKREGRDYSGGPDGCEWIVCPCCKKDVVIRSW